MGRPKSFGKTKWRCRDSDVAAIGELRFFQLAERGRGE